MLTTSINPSNSSLRWTDIPKDIGKGLLNPFVRVYEWIQPSQNPSEILAKIGKASKTALEKATKLGKGVEIPAELIQNVFTPPAAQVTAPIAAAQVSPVIGSRDAEITGILSLQAQGEATDWKAKKEEKLDLLTDQVSAFTALVQMRDWAGIEGEVNNLPLMTVANTIVKGEISPWKAFTQRYQLTFWQKVKAACIYWIFYQTSLISNTVKAYLKNSIEKMSVKIANPDSDEERKLFLEGVLHDINDSLDADLQATGRVARGETRASLHEERNQAATQGVYAGPLADLCKLFGKKRVDKDLPTVNFFSRFHDIPVIGSFFKLFQYLVNKLLIRNVMKSWILPDLLESTVTNGLEATKPNKLPFTVSLTKFLTTKLGQLEETLDNPQQSSSGEARKDLISSATLLPTIIKHFREIIELEPYGTRRDLRKKIEKIEGEKKGWFSWLFEWPNQKVEGALETGAVDSSHLLLDYLNEMARSEELFCHVLDLASAPFSSEITSDETLRKKYEEEKKNLQELSKSVFDKIIEHAVVETVNGKRAEDSRKVANETFQAARLTATQAFAELDRLSGVMRQKVETSTRELDPKKNIQLEVAHCLELLSYFSIQETTQNKLKDPHEANQNKIWRKLTPIYEKAAHLQQQIIQLQELQDAYPALIRMENQLKALSEIFKTIQRQAESNPGQEPTDSLNKCERAAEEIQTYLGKTAPESVKLKDFIKKARLISTELSQTQQTLDAIQALGKEGSEPGLLGQLLSYQQGLHPRGFKPYDCLQKIEQQLTIFPEEERRTLTTLIKNGADLASKWEELKAILNRVNKAFIDKKARVAINLDTHLKEAVQWAEDTGPQYANQKDSTHKKMKEKVEQISRETGALRQKAEQTTLDFGKSPTQWEAIGSTLVPPLMSIAAYSLTPPFVASGAHLLSTGLYLYPRLKPLDAPYWVSAVGAILAGGASYLGGLGTAIAIGTGIGEDANATPDQTTKHARLSAGLALTAGIVNNAASYWFKEWDQNLPSILGVGAESIVNAASGAVLGFYAKRAALAGLKAYVHPKVTEIAHKAYPLLFENRLWKAIAWRMLKRGAQ